MKIVIIGNGIAGITAARRIRLHQPSWNITVISGESAHHFSRPALMYVYLGHLRFEDTKPYEDWLWRKEGLELRRNWVTRIDAEKHRVLLDGGTHLPYDKLLLATGSVPNRFGWPGEHLDGVQGFISLQDLQQLEKGTPDIRQAVLVGGGLIGVELAEMLHARGIKVTILAREPAYWSSALPWEEAQLVTRLIQHEGVDLRLDSELQEIVGDSSGRAIGAITRAGDRIDCQLVGLTAGVRPNLSAVQGSGIPTGRGVLVDEQLRTRVPDVFAAGDCAEIAAGDATAGTVEQLWYTGRMQGEVVADVMVGKDARHDRGIWFNSAKFFDLEWHTYGLVSSHGRPANQAGEKHLYWEHPDGRHSLRLVHHSGAIIGVNAMGLRYRHRTCERWIQEGRSVEFVLDHLGEGAFDPEFQHRYEREIRTGIREVQR